jgi:hypothetical protein
VFAAGAAASAGAAAVALAPVEEAAAARRLTIGGAAAEIAITFAMEQRLSRVGVGEPYRVGAGGLFAKLAFGLTGAGACLLAARGRRSRAAAITGAAFVTGGALAERWAVYKAGFQSAARPQDTARPQRERVTAGETAGAARMRARVGAPAVSGDGYRPGERPVPAGSPAIDTGRH